MKRRRRRANNGGLRWVREPASAFADGLLEFRRGAPAPTGWTIHDSARRTPGRAQRSSKQKRPPGDEWRPRSTLTVTCSVGPAIYAFRTDMHGRRTSVDGAAIRAVRRVEPMAAFIRPIPVPAGPTSFRDANDALIPARDWRRQKGGRCDRRQTDRKAQRQCRNSQHNSSPLLKRCQRCEASHLGVNCQ